MRARADPSPAGDPAAPRGCYLHGLFRVPSLKERKRTRCYWQRSAALHRPAPESPSGGNGRQAPAPLLNQPGRDSGGTPGPAQEPRAARRGCSPRSPHHRQKHQRAAQPRRPRPRTHHGDNRPAGPGPPRRTPPPGAPATRRKERRPGTDLAPHRACAPRGGRGGPAAAPLVTG